MAQAEFLDVPMPDIIEQWRFYLATLNPAAGDIIVDVGCNTGEAERFLIREYPHIAKVIGIENHPTRYERALSRWRDEGSPAQIEFKLADAQELPFPDETADRVLCAETLEWVNHPVKALQEMYRILKPNGRVVVIHTDFDTQVFNAANKQRSRKIVNLFADSGPNGHIGRELYGLCKQASFQTVEPLVYTLVNQEWTPNLYSYQAAQMMVDWLTEQSLISSEELELWLADLAAQQAKNIFFYSVNRYICCCKKRNRSNQ
jgi:arsenite methyltransferase